jgi:hypothetical protein
MIKSAKSTKPIKAKKGWTIFMAPQAPVPPIAPLEFLSDIINILVKKNMNYGNIKLSELELPAMTNGMSLSDVEINVETEFPYHKDEVGGTTLTFYLSKLISNPNYHAQYTRYSVAMKKYELELSRHKQNLKQWKVWKKQEEQDQLETQLKRAKNFLKKNGRL